MHKWILVGSLVSLPVMAQDNESNNGAASIPAGQELVNIDFPDPTEIKDIIRAVSLWTGKNVILDKSVKNKKIQIISPKKVTKEEAYQAFLSALNLLNLTTVETGKIVKILEIRDAVKGNLKTFMGSSWTPMTDEVITQIVPLRYIDSKEIRTTLSKIVPPNAMIAYEATNTLIVSDSGYNVRRILEIIELMDVQGQQPKIEFVPIRFADAKEITKIVSDIYTTSVKASKGKGSSSSSSSQKYKILTDERTNSVIIYGPPRTIDDVKNLVKQFDTPVSNTDSQSSIHIRPLDFADAKKLSSTLTSLIKGDNSSSSRSRFRGSRRTSKDNSSGEDDAAAILSSSDIKITADESSNSLIITGNRSAFNSLNTIIKKLDKRRSQVFIEADILDINMDKGFRFSTHAFTGQGKEGESTVTTTWQAGPVTPLIKAQAATNAGTKATNQQVLEAAAPFAEDLTIGVLSGEKVNIAGLGEFKPGALIKLLKSDANTRVLSSPHILTANNEEASIAVGEKIYFYTAQGGLAAAQNQVNKVESENVELSLNIKPQISHANYVTLDIDLNSDSPSVESSQGLPSINTRKSKQIVTVKNNQTVVVSGLVRTNEYEQYQKIPLLGDIPILGWLFRNSSISSSSSNLMIFLTPHIIFGENDLAKVYQDKINERDNFLVDAYGESIFDSEFYASIPVNKARNQIIITPEDAKQSPNEEETSQEEATQEQTTQQEATQEESQQQDSSLPESFEDGAPTDQQEDLGAGEIPTENSENTETPPDAEGSYDYDSQAEPPPEDTSQLEAVPPPEDTSQLEAAPPTQEDDGAGVLDEE